MKDPELAEERPSAAPASTRSWTGTSCTRSIARWRAIADGYSGAAPARRRGLAARRRSVSPATSARTSSTRPSTSTSSRARGSRGPMRTSIESALAAHAPVDAPDDVGALEPRRDEAGDALRPRPTPRSRSRRKREGTPTDLERGTRRARAAALLAMALPGLDVHLPGRGARAARGRGHPVRPPPGSDVAPLGRRRPRPRRLPDPAALGGRRPPYGFSAERRRPALARPARRLGGLTVERADPRMPTSMLSLYRAGLASAARRALGRGDAASVAPVGRGRPRLRARRAASRASSTSARIRWNFRPAPTSSSPATNSKEVRSRKTQRSGSARRAGSNRSTDPHRITRSDRQGKDRTMKSTRSGHDRRGRRGGPAGRVRDRLERGREERSGARRRRSRSASRR